jgi:hypothetical protein
MQTATAVAQMLIRFTGLLQIVLGVLFWSGRARNMIAVHMLLGFVLALALWALAGLAARGGVGPGLVTLAVLWGGLVPLLGLTQERLPPGDGQWPIQALHLLVGLGAIGLGEGLAARIRRARGPAMSG